MNDIEHLSVEQARETQDQAEQLAEHKAFLSEYVRDALLGELVAVHAHTEALRKLQSISEYGLGGIIPECIRELIEMIEIKVYELVDQAEQDLNDQVFTPDLLQVYLVSGEGTQRVEKVLQDQTQLFPVIGGEIYRKQYHEIVII